MQNFGQFWTTSEFDRENMQNFGQFWTTSEFDREYLQNGSRYPKSENVIYKLWQFLLRMMKKSGELWSTNGLELHVSLDPPKMHFFGMLYLGPYGVLHPEFLHALEIDQALLAHTPSGARVPPPPPQKKKIKLEH